MRTIEDITQNVLVDEFNRGNARKLGAAALTLLRAKYPHHDTSDTFMLVAAVLLLTPEDKHKILLATMRNKNVDTNT